MKNLWITSRPYPWKICVFVVSLSTYSLSDFYAIKVLCNSPPTATTWGTLLHTSSWPPLKYILFWLKYLILVKVSSSSAMDYRIDSASRPPTQWDLSNLVGYFGICGMSRRIKTPRSQPPRKLAIWLLCKQQYHTQIDHLPPRKKKQTDHKG